MAEETIGFSVVVPSFNQGRFIDDTLQSLLEQKYPALEILVVDGGSTDDTVERLTTYGDQIRWISEKDNGQTDAIIKGFSQTSHPWLTWLNSDDVQCGKALWRVAERIAAEPSVEVVVGGGHYMAADGGFLRDYPTIAVHGPMSVRDEIFHKGYMAQPSVFFRRDVYDAIGGLNPNLNFCMDYDLWARLAVHGAKFARIHADLSGNRWYETTKTAGQTLALYAEIIATQHRTFRAVSPYFVQAVSDHLYSRFHSPAFGDQAHLFHRWLYFKAVWLALNGSHPWYCLRGLVTATIAKSGPVTGDTLTASDWLRSVRAMWLARGAKP